jgi:hypothetical protein
MGNKKTMKHKIDKQNVKRDARWLGRLVKRMCRNTGQVYYGKTIDLSAFSKTPGLRGTLPMPRKTAQWLRDSFGEAVYIKGLLPYQSPLPTARGDNKGSHPAFRVVKHRSGKFVGQMSDFSCSINPPVG